MMKRTGNGSLIYKYLKLITFTALSLSFSWTSAAETQDILRFRLTGDPATLDWNLAHTSHETYIIMNIMEGLVEEGPDLKPVPALAESWTISADGKTYTFQIRKNVKWTDGQPLSAQQFVDSWLRLLSPASKSNYADFLFGIVNAEAFHKGKIKDPDLVGIKALGPNSLEIKLRQPLPYFIHIPTFWVTFPIRMDLIKKFSSSWANSRNLVTLGRYKLKKWEKNKLIELEANANHYSPLKEGRNPIHIEGHIERDDKKARILFQEGKIDFLTDITTSDLLTLKLKNQRIEYYPYLATYYLGFNFKKKTTQDLNMRRAIALAINKEQIPTLLQGGQKVSTGWVAPGIDGSKTQVQAEGSLYDAQAALVKAGFPEGRGLSKLSLIVESFDGSKQLGDFLANNLRTRLGIEIAPQYPSPEEFQRLRKSGKADLFLGHWGADYPDAASFFEIFESQSGNNHTAWKNPTYDQLVQKAEQTLDSDDRLELYKKAETILTQTDIAIVPLFYKSNSAVISKKIKELKISPLNYLFFKDVVVQ